MRQNKFETDKGESAFTKSCRRTVMAELSEVKLTWGETKHAAENRAKLKESVVALCPTGGEEGSK